MAEALVAIDMVRMDMGIDDIADGNLRSLLNLVTKSLTLIGASSAVNDGDTALTDDKADIGDLAPIFYVGNFMNALMDKDTGSHFLEGQSFGPEGRSQS
jgi:hypothetical protein